MPAGEWKGAAVNAMVENGKLIQMAEVVLEPGDDGYVEKGANVQQLPGGEPPAPLHWGVGTLDESDARRAERGEIAPLPEKPDEDDDGTPPPGPDAYPIFLQKGHWRLSDGTEVYGRNAAKAKQRALNEASEEAAKEARAAARAARAAEPTAEAEPEQEPGAGDGDAAEERPGETEETPAEGDDAGEAGDGEQAAEDETETPEEPVTDESTLDSAAA